VTPPFPGLVQDADGIWSTPASGAVSYPSGGNAACHAVEADSFWFNHRNAAILDAIRCFPPAGPLLDIGASLLAVAMRPHAGEPTA